MKNIPKGGIFSKSFSHWLKSCTQSCQINLLSTFPLMQSAQESGLAPSFGDLSQSKNIFCK
jgi:hypothetical protein